VPLTARDPDHRFGEKVEIGSSEGARSRCWHSKSIFGGESGEGITSSEWTSLDVSFGAASILQAYLIWILSAPLDEAWSR
jgi:hypothetical protein